MSSWLVDTTGRVPECTLLWTRRSERVYTSADYATFPESPERSSYRRQSLTNVVIVIVALGTISFLLIGIIIYAYQSHTELTEDKNLKKNLPIVN
ncbi:hypothetical protein B566_EDAN011945, partial [Ephemera danica]